MSLHLHLFRTASVWYKQIRLLIFRPSLADHKKFLLNHKHVLMDKRQNSRINKHLAIFLVRFTWNFPSVSTPSPIYLCYIVILMAPNGSCFWVSKPLCCPLSHWLCLDKWLALVNGASANMFVYCSQSSWNTVLRLYVRKPCLASLSMKDHSKRDLNFSAVPMEPSPQLKN